MYWPHREPTLWEMLSDPIVKAVMEADGVDAQEVMALLRQAGRELTPGSSWFTMSVRCHAAYDVGNSVLQR